MFKGNLEGNKDVQVQKKTKTLISTAKQHSVIQRGAILGKIQGEYFSAAPLICAVSCFLYFHCIHNINSSILLSQER